MKIESKRAREAREIQEYISLKGKEAKPQSIIDELQEAEDEAWIKHFHNDTSSEDIIPLC